MLVKLTKSGLRLFGFDTPERAVISVSTKRAYTLMAGGYANRDMRFMSLYAMENPEETPKSEPDLQSEDSKSEDESNANPDPVEMTKKELKAFLGDGNYPENATKSELLELAMAMQEDSTEDNDETI